MAIARTNPNEVTILGEKYILEYTADVALIRAIQELTKEIQKLRIGYQR